MESYITIKKEDNTRHFYVYNDGQAKEKGFNLTIHDFAGYFLFLAGEGWQVIKEINIPLPERDHSMEMPLPGRSRKAEFAHEWGKYLTANIENL